MKTMRTRFLSILALALVATFTLTSCEKDDVNEIPAPANDVVELAQATSELSTLVTAVVTADLASTLKGSGPFTVFAPTNAAFAKLDDGVLEVLLANPSVLADLLKYHVVSGKVLSSDLTTTTVQTLLSGKSISVSVANGVTLNGTASVVEADIEATNGVVHVIDEVLIPEGFELPKDNIVSIAAQTPSLSILVEALSLFPNLVDALSSDGSFTVFAPTNDAFVALLGVIGQESLSDVPESVIERLLKYHVISGAALMSTDLSDGQMASTLLSADDKVKVQISGQSVKINLN